MADASPRTVPRRVIRDVELGAVRDLLDHPPRATVAFVDQGAISLVPARARCTDGAYTFGVRHGEAPDLSGGEVVLLIDDGPYWFELRGISVRGSATKLDAGQQLDSSPLDWYTIAPRRVLAWDYGAIREE